MRDLHLRHTLKTLARDASGVFTDIVESGQEIPYEIADPGGSFAFSQYRPLTARFVRDNAAELRELETFREASETMRRSEVAAAYLEEGGVVPPADPYERATLAVTYFLARLWDGCSDFEIDEDRFSAALAEVEDCAEPEEGEVEAIVPLVGFRMPGGRLELAGATIVRADSVDVPPEAARADGAERGDWEPSFLISAREQLTDEGGLGAAGQRVAATFERVITTLRLHKPGGVGLGPHGWVRVAGDRWRKIATGAARPRAGGYRLEEEELGEVADLARTVSVHSRRVGRLRRALLRFEAGLDRRGAIDALNDHLLGLRFLLEGEGPAGVGLPMRVAALTSEGEERVVVRDCVEHALSLERELWSGEPSGAESVSPAEIATTVEQLLRDVLRRAIGGELGADLRAAADEILLADGFAVGEGAERGATSEWEPDDAGEPEHATTSFEEFERDPDPAIRASRAGNEMEEIEMETFAESREDASEGAEPENAPETVAEHTEAVAEESEPAVERAEAAAEETRTEPEPEPAGWLGEVGGEETMDFPTPANHLRELAKPPMDREEVRARVEYLFPRTETDWTVGGDSPRRKVAAG